MAGVTAGIFQIVAPLALTSQVARLNSSVLSQLEWRELQREGCPGRSVIAVRGGGGVPARGDAYGTFWS